MTGETCPWCGAKAVDVTCAGDPRKSYICCGDPCHEWLQGEAPEPEPDEPDDKEFLDSLATRVAEIVTDKLAKPERPSLLKRLFA